MTVRRIVPDIALADPAQARAFYEEVLGLKVVMDQGFIITFASDVPTTPQISIASEGGAGTPVPDVSIEVDDLEAVHHRAVSAGHEIVYGPSTEAWGVRRFFVRDPAGKLLNILCHTN